MLFLVKSKWQIEKAPELAQKMATGEIPEIAKWEGYCAVSDSSIGFNLYEAKDEEDLRRMWEPYLPYGKILEITAVMTVGELMQGIQK
ncbi:MAG: DUF3303 family protein [bacterium]